MVSFDYLLFDFKSCAEFVDNKSVLETDSKRIVKDSIPGNNLKSKSHVFAAPQINHDTGLWENGFTRHKAIYVS